MAELVNTWVMKSVNPPQAGWYMVWREDEPELIQPHHWDGKSWNYGDFEMWCRQPVPPDVNAYHQLRAILAAKNN